MLSFWAILVRNPSQIRIRSPLRLVRVSLRLVLKTLRDHPAYVLRSSQSSPDKTALMALIRRGESAAQGRMPTTPWEIRLESLLSENAAWNLSPRIRTWFSYISPSSRGDGKKYSCQSRQRRGSFSRLRHSPRLRENSITSIPSSSRIFLRPSP